MALALASAFGLQGWRTLFNNFAVEIGRVDGLDMGFIQSVREVPGFLALRVAYLPALSPGTPAAGPGRPRPAGPQPEPGPGRTMEQQGMPLSSCNPPG